MINRLSGHRGLSMVEVLIALTILAVALVPMILAFEGSLKTVTQSDEILTASNLAKLKVEQAKTTAYGSVGSVSRTSFSSTEDPSQQYEYEQIVTGKSDTVSGAEYKEVEIKVYRTGQSSAVVELVTCIANGGI